MGPHAKLNTVWHERLAQEARILGEARMLRDDQDLTPELSSLIIKRLREFLKRVDRKEAWAARSMGIGASTLSGVLNDNYAGDTEGHIRKIDKWLEIQIAKENAPRPPGFVKTTTAMVIIGVAKMITKAGGIAVVHGPSGIGKTITAQYIRSEYPGSIYIRVTTAGSSRTSVLNMLAKELTLGGISMSCFQLEEQVVGQLRDSQRLIIVDEVHRLCGTRKKDEGMHVLRDLLESTGCPMLWLGTGEIASYLDQGKNIRDTIEQIYGRVTWIEDLTSVAMGANGGPGLHTIEDIRNLMAEHAIRVTPDAEHYLLEMANSKRNGGLRPVMRLCQLVQFRAPGKTVTLEMLQDLQRARLGTRVAEQVEKRMEMRRAMSA